MSTFPNNSSTNGSTDLPASDNLGDQFDSFDKSDSLSDLELYEIQQKIIDLENGRGEKPSGSQLDRPASSTLQESKPATQNPQTNQRNATSDTFPPIFCRDGIDDNGVGEPGLSRSAKSARPSGSSGFLQTPSNKKRSRGSDENFSANTSPVRKSRRPTPIPSAAESSNETPTDLHKLLGLSDDDDLLQIEAETREAERWLQEKREQERKDEEFARSLQRSLDPSFSPPSPTFPGPDYVHSGPPRSHPHPYDNTISIDSDSDQDVVISNDFASPFLGFQTPSMLHAQPAQYGRSGGPLTNDRFSRQPAILGPNDSPYRSGVDPYAPLGPHPSGQSLDHLFDRSAPDLHAVLSVPGAASSLLGLE